MDVGVLDTIDHLRRLRSRLVPEPVCSDPTPCCEHRWMHAVTCATLLQERQVQAAVLEPMQSWMKRYDTAKVPTCLATQVEGIACQKHIMQTCQLHMS